MKFVFFSVSENGENGLGDEGADGAMPNPLRIFGLEPPLTHGPNQLAWLESRHLLDAALLLSDETGTVELSQIAIAVS